MRFGQKPLRICLGFLRRGFLHWEDFYCDPNHLCLFKFCCKENELMLSFMFDQITVETFLGCPLTCSVSGSLCSFTKGGFFCGLYWSLWRCKSVFDCESDYKLPSVRVSTSVTSIVCLGKSYAEFGCHFFLLLGALSLFLRLFGGSVLKFLCRLKNFQ